MVGTEEEKEYTQEQIEVAYVGWGEQDEAISHEILFNGKVNSESDFDENSFENVKI